MKKLISELLENCSKFNSYINFKNDHYVKYFYTGDQKIKILKSDPYINDKNFYFNPENVQKLIDIIDKYKTEYVIKIPLLFSSFSYITSANNFTIIPSKSKLDTDEYYLNNDSFSDTIIDKINTSDIPVIIKLNKNVPIRNLNEIYEEYFNQGFVISMDKFVFGNESQFEQIESIQLTKKGNLITFGKDEKDVREFLDRWTDESFFFKSIYSSLSDVFRKTVQEKNYILCRGIYYVDDELQWKNWETDLIDIRKDRIELKIKQVTSWTTDWCRAIYFAQNSSVSYDKSLILVTEVSDDKIFADLRNIKYYTSLEYSKEFEVLLKEGTYKCKLFDLLGNPLDINKFQSRESSSTDLKKPFIDLVKVYFEKNTILKNTLGEKLLNIKERNIDNYIKKFVQALVEFNRKNKNNEQFMNGFILFFDKIFNVLSNENIGRIIKYLANNNKIQIVDNKIAVWEFRDNKLYKEYFNIYNLNKDSSKQMFIQYLYYNKVLSFIDPTILSKDFKQMYFMWVPKDQIKPTLNLEITKTNFKDFDNWSKSQLFKVVVNNILPDILKKSEFEIDPTELEHTFIPQMYKIKVDNLLKIVESWFDDKFMIEKIIIDEQFIKAVKNKEKEIKYLSESIYQFDKTLTINQLLSVLVYKKIIRDFYLENKFKKLVGGNLGFLETYLSETRKPYNLDLLKVDSSYFEKTIKELANACLFNNEDIEMTPKGKVLTIEDIGNSYKNEDSLFDTKITLKIYAFLRNWIDSSFYMKSTYSKLNDVFQSTVQEKKYLVCRGLRYNKKNAKWSTWENDLIEIKKNSISLKINTITSWTTNWCIANVFSKPIREDDIETMDDTDNNIDDGKSLILVTIVEKSQVFCDLRNIEHYENESELILKEGTFNCKIFDSEGNIVDINKFNQRESHIDEFQKIIRGGKTENNLNISKICKNLKKMKLQDLRMVAKKEGIKNVNIKTKKELLQEFGLLLKKYMNKIHI